jgi:hypothetical protein
MSHGDEGRIYRFTALALAAGLLTMSPWQGVRAEGLFESLFNSLGRVLHAPERVPEQIPAFAEPQQNPEDATRPPQRQVEAGPAKAFCVRSCDGHYFPVRAHAGMSAADACHSFCPASQTKLFSGSTIDHAVARDGSRYADLAHAYAYRRGMVAGCTCNGHSQFGLAQIDVTSDPTLKPGDVVATPSGMVVFTDRKDGTAEFSPVASYSHFSKSYRDQLAAMRIMPANPSAPPEAATSSVPEEARSGNLRSAQR